MNPRWRHLVPWLVPVTVAGLLVWTSVFTGRRHRVVRAIMRPIPYSDKVGHILLYGALTASVILLLERRRHSRVVVAAVGAIIFGLGVLDEIRQVGQPHRSFSLRDLTANAIGVLLGALLGMLIARFWPRRS